MPSVSVTGCGAASAQAWRGPGHQAVRCGSSGSSGSAHWPRQLGPAPETVRSPRWCSDQPDNDNDYDDDDELEVTLGYTGSPCSPSPLSWTGPGPCCRCQPGTRLVLIAAAWNRKPYHDGAFKTFLYEDWRSEINVVIRADYFGNRKVGGQKAVRGGGRSDWGLDRILDDMRGHLHVVMPGARSGHQWGLISGQWSPPPLSGHWQPQPPPSHSLLAPASLSPVSTAELWFSYTRSCYLYVTMQKVFSTKLEC